MSLKLTIAHCPDSFQLILVPLEPQTPGHNQSLLIPISATGKTPFQIFITQKPGQPKLLLQIDLETFCKKKHVTSESELMNTLKNFLQKGVSENQFNYEVR